MDDAAVSILVADDNGSALVALEAILAPLGHNVIAVDSGRAALAAVLEQDFAVVLLDVHMPILGGFETAGLIRLRPQSSATPIIFLTADDESSADIRSGYALGAVDFVVAPFAPDILRAKVSAFIEFQLHKRRLMRNVAEIAALRDAYRDSATRAQAVLDNVGEAIVSAGEDGLIDSFNRSAASVFGYQEDEAIGLPLQVIVAAEHQVDFRSMVAADAPDQRREMLGRRKDGGTFPMEVGVSTLQQGGRTLETVCIRDISKRVEDARARAHEGLHDPLTGLPNRLLFTNRLEHAIRGAAALDTTFAILIMDLDDFKRVNDLLGDEVGDSLLHAAADRLVDRMSDLDTVSRLGGDEFGVLLHGPAALEEVVARAWKLRRAFDEPFPVDGSPVAVSTSIGIALYPNDGSNVCDLIRRANMAMYDAKRSGTGCSVFSSEQEVEKAGQVTLLADLQHCIARDQLVLKYQPKIDLTSGLISGVEALLRWRSPSGDLMPNRFMPQLEFSDMIRPVTRWVLNEALRQQSVWREAGLDLSMAVNISAKSLCGPELPCTVAELSRLWGTSRERLTLELTESSLMEAADPGVLRELHDLGRLSIDDFGTKYSSLVYLQQLAVDEIKVDQSFVAQLATTNDDAVIVRSTIDLGHNLGLTVVAEGVEDRGALSVLVNYGCDMAQGYFFCRPIAGDDVAAWLSGSRYEPLNATKP